MHTLHTVAGSSRAARLLPAGVLLLAFPLAAQVKIGDLSTNLSGTIAPGYTADYGNETGSDHSWALGGSANLSGSFYNPNFLSFNVGVYLNQSRANSDYQSITDASGVNATATVFGGSRFPGSINYSKAINSEGSYALPGVANYVTHGNSDSFGINWSENLPDAPSFSAGFQLGNSQYSVYGANESGDSSFHSLNLHSGYRVAGFNMGAYYTSGGGHSVIPQLLSGEQPTEADNSTSGYGFNLSHRLPWQGSLSAGINRSTWDSNYLGSTSTGTVDTVNAIAAVHPIAKLSISASANYSDNLSGQLIEALVAAGGASEGFNTDESSNSLDLDGVVSYNPLPNMQTSAFVERRTQNFLGQSYGVDSFGASGSYSHELLNGNFNAAVTVSENTSDQSNENTLGFSTTENYSSQILGWKVTGSFGYSQNVQTLLVTYMNSFYNYSGNARHRFGKLLVGAGAGASRTALTQQAGTADSSESFNASVGYDVMLVATGSYSRSNGQALATGAGLVLVPVPSPILNPDLVSLFGGDSYAAGLSSAPVKHLILTASYSKSTSNTSSGAITSANETSQFYSTVQYQYRKLGFNSGFARLEQGFSASGTQPEVISSFYIGVSRWFNFF